MHFDIDTYNPMEAIGKIEDAGKLVEGGGIDRYWKRHPISLDFKKLFNDTISNDWLYDSNLALKHFNLRSIEFGNWMNQKDRANFLYSSSLSLHHLALIYDLKDDQIGLNGKLSLALGARGSGQALAHYEPLKRSVINLTKTKGVGSLAHEFAHAIDNIISFYTGGKVQKWVSGGDSIRKGYSTTIAKKGNYFEKQFEELFNILYYTKEGKKTDFNTDISKLPDYWNQRNEVFARTFEVYTFYKLKEQGMKNQFLAKSSYANERYPSIDLVLKASRHIDNIIKRGFNLMKRNKALSGLVTVSGYDGFRKTLKKHADLEDTLNNMQRIALRDTPQVKELATSLQGNTVAETAQNIWNYLRANTRYKLDQNGIEELRTPVRSLVDGKKGITDPSFGIDCDDYTILISALLLNLNIRHEYRVTAYKEIGKFQHIYPVAFDSLGNHFVIDVVPEIPRFNYEAKPIIDLKTIPMELHELSGVGDELPNSVLEEQKHELLEELNQPFSLSGIDDENDDILEDSFLSGFAEVETEEEAEIVLNGRDDINLLIDRGLLAEVNKSKVALEKELRNPTALSQTINVRRELALIKTVMQRWNNEDAREAAIQNAINSGSSYSNFYKALQVSINHFENESLQGIDDEELDEPIYLAKVDMTNVQFDDLLDDENPELSGLGDLGRRRRRRGFFKRIWRKVKKVGKKVIKAVKKFSPSHILIRAAIRLVLKINLFKIASRLIYGYLTETQAKERGMDLNQWRKVVRAKNRLEKFYVKRMGGKASKFRKAIVSGRARKKTGVRLSGTDDLGVVVTTTAAAGTTAASGFIVFAKKILKFVKLDKLFKKVVDKIKKKRRGGDSNQATTNTIEPNTVSTVKFEDTNPHFNEQSTSFNTRSMNNNPAIPTPTPVGFKSKVIAFFKKHKKKIIGSGIVVVLAIIGVLFWQKSKKKKKRSLAGVKAAKTRARNRKRALNGVSVRRSGNTPKRRTSPKTLKIASGTVGRVRSGKRSNGNRLKQMHAKAKQLQKKHPRSKYSTLLKRAAKMI